MKLSRIETASITGFTLCFGLTSWLFYATYQRNQEVLLTERDIDHTYEIAGEIKGLLISLLDAETGARGYVITGKEEYLVPFQKGQAALSRVFQHINSSEWTPEKRVQLSDLQKKSLERIDILKKIVDARRKTGFEAARDVQYKLQSREAMDTVRGLVYQFLEDEQARLKKRIHASEMGASEASRAFALSGIFIALVLLGLGTVVFNQFSRIKKVADDLLTENIERKRVESKLIRSNEELQQFAYVASHDLQEPLRAVAGFLGLIQKNYAEILDERAERWIGLSIDGAHRMQALIQDLLLLSRVETRGEAFHLVPLKRILASAERNLQAAMAETDASVVSQNADIEVFGDEAQLVQLFQNLIANGIKFRKTDKSKIEITAVRENEHMWRVGVRDNGIGFDVEHADRIFQMFQRLQTRTKYEGTGIGLAICKKIVERHGGRIWADSVPDNGSTFWFTLPSKEQTQDEIRGE